MTMCGICGKISLNGSPVDRDLLTRMTGCLSHRGPDGEGLFLDQGRHHSVGLGQRRLSIIDLSDAGRQPMANEDETLWIVFNGEIYNFQPLRDELERKGHRFRSRTDTEVILHLFEEEGPAGISKLRGMFAFAVWDTRTETLLLARDRVGIKPLVYYRDDDSFLFASEIKSLLQDPRVSKEMDPEALELYFTLNYIPAPYTIFRNIRKLRPGHYLLLHRSHAQEKEYWNIIGPGETENPAAQDWESRKASLFQTLEEAVRSHMIADVPLGAFLSGGIDSSVIVGLMSRNSAQRVRTFTIGYPDMPLFDERDYAREVARLNDTDHHEIPLLSRDILSAVPAVLDSFDEPFADSSAIPTYIVSRETSRQVKVALSGDGGDELFAGYRMYAGEYWYQHYRLIPPWLRHRLIEPFVSALPDSRDYLLTDYVRRLKKFLKGTGDSFADRFFNWNEIFPKAMRKDILLRSGRMNIDLGKEILTRRLGEMAGDKVNRMLYADFKESLPGDMLLKVDAMSMLHGLEVRVPLLDHRVCELSFSFNGNLKMNNGRGKYIFLETFKDILPPALLSRPKWGFEIPLGKWLKGDLHYLLDEYLSRGLIRRQAIFNPDVVDGLIRNLTAKGFDSSWHLWNLIVFQNWYFRHIEDLRGYRWEK